MLWKILLFVSAISVVAHHATARESSAKRRDEVVNTLRSTRVSKDDLLTEKRRDEKISALKTTVSEALIKSAQRRLAEEAVAKGSPLARTLVDLRDDLYVRDMYFDIVGGATQQQTEDFFNDVCGIDIGLYADMLDDPVGPLDIVEGSKSIQAFLDGVKADLAQQFEMASSKGPQGESKRGTIRETRMPKDELITSILNQPNGMKEHGLCALYDVVLIVLRLIEHGASGFSHHEYCYNTVHVFNNEMAAYNYDLEAIAMSILQDDMSMPEAVSQAVRDDMECIRLQIEDLKRLLQQGMDMDGQKTESEAWDVTVGVIHQLHQVITEHQTLVATLQKFASGQAKVEAIMSDLIQGNGDENEGEESDGTNDEKRDLLELLEKLLEKN